ncbi:MAG: int [Myxococcales bacterium]|nr:int [Myxococcales bacterium]
MTVKRFGDRWGIDVEVGNRRLRLRSPENTRQGALAYEAHIRKKLVWEQEHPEDAITPPTFAEFVPEWFETYVKTNNKPSEIAGKESRLRVHLVPFFGRMRLNEINGLALERYKALKIRSGLNPNTINKHLGILGKSLQTAEEWGRLGQAPRMRRLRKVPRPTPRFLTEEECRALLDAARGTTWWLPILVGMHAGLRRAEILALHREDIDLERRQIYVRHNFSEHILTTPKSCRNRVVPLSRTLFEEFSKLPRGTGYVFTKDGRLPWKVYDASGYLQRIGKRAGVPSTGMLGWHILRHYAASRIMPTADAVLLVRGRALGPSRPSMQLDSA